MNTSGINPTGFNVVVKVEKPSEKTSGGLYKTDQQLAREEIEAVKGVMVAAAAGAFSHVDWPDGASPPPVGSRVLLRKHAGAISTGNDGLDYRVCEDKDILAALEG